MKTLRSLLFVPATSERKIAKAFEAGADGVIVDLEDAVAVAQKPAARAALGPILAESRQLPLVVRVNAVSSPFCLQDLLAVAVPGVAAVLLPKVESPEQVRRVDWILSQLETERGLPAGGIALMGIVETAQGLAAVDASAAASPRLRRLMFGAVDLVSDMMLDPADEGGAIAQARFAIARASIAAGLEPPMDTAYIDVQNDDGLRATSERARAFGYSGKACIHPRQVAIVNAVFTPSDAEVGWARRIVEGFDRAERDGAAAVLVDGLMVDYPVVERARRILARLPA